MSWEEDLVAHVAAEGDERSVRRAIRETIEEAARRCRRRAKLFSHERSIGAEYCAEAIEAMLKPQPEVKR